ncbi:MAG: hypothetical protein A2098_02125 [Chlamydiae bacterium GWF2_49_8]|nr:MAG: hypothetical protein A2098_02125 [Chlamydiae bacterium GWF2_49_8]
MNWKELNRRGLFPGPAETEEEFFKRVERVGPSAQSFPHIETLFGCAPDWVPLSYSNRGLAPWQGAAVWIEEGSARIQLKKGFQKGRYLRIYSESEVLSHELVHLVRMAFDEPRYEEIFAYLASKSAFRRAFGPLFCRPGEAALFFALSFFPFLSFFWPTPLFLAFPGIYLLFLLWRLYKSRKRLNRCLENLASIAPRPLVLAVRLSDEEVALFAALSAKELRAYIAGKTSFRWRFLKATLLNLQT